VLYWFVNNLFSIGQQFIVNTQFKNANDAEVALVNAKKIDKKSNTKDGDK
jgi:YidC/Oxa1 family membrane protein insertase